jgi:hydrogenase maturation protease
MTAGNKKSVLVVGIGNTIRGDDGIGCYICQSIEMMNLDAVKTMMVQQLDSNLLEEFIQADLVILTDASVEGDPVRFYSVHEERPSVLSSSHHMSATLLMQMAKQLYQKGIAIMICAVGGYHFSVSDKLSARAKKNAAKAVIMICDWIKKNS